MPPHITSQSPDFSKFFSQFPISGFPADQAASAQRRNLEAFAAAAQLTTESWMTVYRRQVEIFTQATVDGASELQHLWSPGGANEKFAQQTDVVKTNFEKGLTNFREVSQILGKANAEATDLLAKRVTESLVELKSAVAKAQSVAKTSAA